MRNPPLILAVDDEPDTLDTLAAQLSGAGYAVATADTGPAALDKVRALLPDLVLLDNALPGLTGVEVVRAIKADASLPFTPVIMVTGRAEPRSIVEGLDAGADDYLGKPVDAAALMARVRAMLRLKGLHDTAQRQARALERQAEELAKWSARLEERVVEQVATIARIERFRRFLPPQVAEILASGRGGTRDPLASHRGPVTVVFADLRGFTAFVEAAPPDTVMAVLRAYHAAVGELAAALDGTLERFVGDGVLVLFNDPLPQADHVLRGVRLALALRERVAGLARGWAAEGHALGLGIGIATGEATIGSVGFENRLEYSVIGSVPNLAARLCEKAEAGRIVTDEAVCRLAGPGLAARPAGALSLKGFARPIAAFEIDGLGDRR